MANSYATCVSFRCWLDGDNTMVQTVAQHNARWSAPSVLRTSTDEDRSLYATTAPWLTPYPGVIAAPIREERGFAE